MKHKHRMFVFSLSMVSKDMRIFTRTNLPYAREACELLVMAAFTVSGLPPVNLTLTRASATDDCEMLAFRTEVQGAYSLQTMKKVRRNFGLLAVALVPTYGLTHFVPSITYDNGTRTVIP